MQRSEDHEFGGIRILPGETQDIRLKVSETFAGEPIELTARVLRAVEPGPKVFVTAAIHGNEVNGTGIVRELLFRQPPKLIRGTLICLPVVNIFGFERHDRYMPDRRDLNRSFPGIETGSLSARFAAVVFRELAEKCDYGIDLHTAAIHRTNFPNVRADLYDPQVKRLAKAFGTELIVHGKGPQGSFRRAAGEVGCPTIILEAGEVSKIEPSVLAVGLRGMRNVLIELDMIEGTPQPPVYQSIVHKTRWVRAEVGGLLRFHVSLGDIVDADQPLATSENVFGDAQSVLHAPFAGIVMSLTTHPAVQPGEPVCHIAVPRKSLDTIRSAIARAKPHTLVRQVREHLATNISVTGEGGEQR